MINQNDFLEIFGQLSLSSDDQFVEKLNKALIFATMAHHNDYRKGTSLPYILHPIEAASIVARISDDKDLIIAALLHDTIEDAGVKYDDILKIFGKKVADLVNSESEDKTKTWEERKSYTLNTLKNESLDVKIVTLGDKLSNIRSSYHDFNSIGDKIWERFNVKDKSKQGWYYKGIVDCLSDLSNTKEWQELKLLTEKIFD